MINGNKKLNGDAAEKSVEEILKELEVDYEKQVIAPKSISLNTMMDFKVTFKNGHILWIGVTGDLYDGTAQKDRLALIWKAWKYDDWKPNHAFYALKRAHPAPYKGDKPTIMQQRNVDAYYDLAAAGVIGSYTKLAELINGLMSEN